MQRCDFYEWEYLYFEKLWVYVNLHTEEIIAIIKTKQLN